MKNLLNTLFKRKALLHEIQELKGKLNKEKSNFDKQVFDILSEIKCQTNDSHKVKILYIGCVEVRKFYDSKWEIAFLDKGELNFISLTCDERESHSSLLKALEKCETVEEIQKLDYRDKIYYD